MRKILLVEPDYPSKFPPLGLLRIGNYHKSIGDEVLFARGRVLFEQGLMFDRIYISSLFTWELPRTLKIIKYYKPLVDSLRNIFVGGIGVTLLPWYISETEPEVTILKGALDKENLLEEGSPCIESLIPDFSLLTQVDYHYQPADVYFSRISKGCIRKCKFCAVPKLEPKHGHINNWRDQINAFKEKFGEKQHLVLLDNNILAEKKFDRIVHEIVDIGFYRGVKYQNKKRHVDFNQGLDARLMTPKIAKLLSLLPVHPVRFAFDSESVKDEYENAIQLLSNEGFMDFTSYVMYNFDDDPESLYRRLKFNITLSNRLNIRVTGFPMRYVPIEDITRGYISPKWKWRMLRGMQCILGATHGVVTPKKEFFDAAFGSSVNEFKNILSMPDRYIMYRKKYAQEISCWSKTFTSFSRKEKIGFLELLHLLNGNKDKTSIIKKQNGHFSLLLEHYYPNGKVVRE